MNKPLKINKSISIDEIELLLKKINNSKTPLDIQLPLSIDYTGFSVLPTFFQLIFTWMRNKDGMVILPINEKEKIEYFAIDYYGYVLLSTIWRSFSIVNKDSKNIKLEFKIFTSKMHNYLDSLAPQLPNESILIPSFDHYSQEKGLSHWFYNFDFNFFETPSELENSIFHLLSHISKNYKKRLKRNINDSFDALTRIVWELLKNTDEHAKTDYLDEVKLLPNTRCLFMKVHRSSKDKFITKTQHIGLRDYYEDALEIEGDSFVLEISVFDSGPGLVKRFLGKEWKDNLSMDKIIEVVKNCLFKGQSSVQNVDGKNKGFGLDEVLTLLDHKKGFLRIRTGEVSIYKNLIKSKHKRFNSPSEIELFDWQTQSNTVFTKMPKAEGTAITLAIPLN